ncbi:MAG: hypothetical protein CMJ39_08510 [Phycisphaerae bacterium]|nr:hypothetical protein [Phycisphaerae bacterium]
MAALLALILMIPALLPVAEPTQPNPVRRSPLLSEGTLITNAEGIMVQDGKLPLRLFRLTGEDAGGQDQRQFVLLPCALLQEMEAKADSIAPAKAMFSVSGEVLTYGNKNWLLPQHVEWMTDHADRDETDTLPSSPSDELTEEDASSDAVPVDDFDRDQGDSIADIVADLQSSVGPLRRSVDAGDQETAEPVAGPAEGKRLVSRRGRLARGRTGAWTFVLDADITGLNDPSMILLPSKRLTQLETYGGYGWLGQPMLISGEVFTYRGRHFLRPTAWKMVRERPNLIR